MTQTITRLPPPPPNARPHMVVKPRASIVTGHYDLGHYKMPMASQYVPAWAAVLKSVGYPTDVVVLDFETYFDTEYHLGRDGKALSTIEFVRDSRFEAISLAATQMSGSTPFADYTQRTQWVISEEEIEKLLTYLKNGYGQNLERATVVVANATFDCTVLSRRYNIHPPHVVDILGIARFLNSRDKHGVGTLVERFNLPAKGETEAFRGVTLRTRFSKGKGRTKGPKLPVQQPKITDEQIVALREYNVNDNLREWELFTLMLPMLSNPKTELRLMQHHLEIFTKPVLRVDFEKGEELIRLMEAEIDRVMLNLGVTREEISGDKSFGALLDTALEAAGDNPQKYYKPGARGYILAIAKPDPERELLLRHESPRVRELMAARIALDSWPTHIGRVKRIMAQARADCGLLPVPLKYHGAHTGRASGGEKINLQNLGSRGHELVNAIRLLLVAALDHLLAIVDAAAIEARVLAWIAGQWDLVEKFANNEEIYCGFASKVLGYPVRKAKKTGGIPAIEARMTWARNSVGKIGVLGCGYGMGPDKTEAYAKGAIDNATAHKIVETYRAENQEIVKFWKALERAFTYVAKYQRPAELPRGLRFDSDPSCDVIITLPNGRELRYPRVKLVPHDRGATIEVYNNLEHRWEHIWGGHLAENIVQAISRDVLMEAMLRLEDAGHHTAHHIHDELVLCVPKDIAPAVLKLAIEELSRTPVWAPRLALGAEGVLSERYGKH